MHRHLVSYTLNSTVKSVTGPSVAHKKDMVNNSITFEEHIAKREVLQTHPPYGSLLNPLVTNFMYYL